MKFVTLGTSENGVTLIGQEFSVAMSMDSATRLRNHLCKVLGSPTEDEVKRPDGDLTRMALELGGIVFDERTGTCFDASNMDRQEKN